MRVNFCQNQPEPRQFSPAINGGPPTRQVTPPLKRSQDLPEHLKNTLKQRWPEAVRSLSDRSDFFFATGLPELDRLFSSGRGIPYGQLIEVTGGPSSGKTSLLFRLLSMGSKHNRNIAYVDFNDALFPDAAIASEIDLPRLLVIKPVDHNTDHIKTGIRTAELLLRDRHANIVVFDLVGQRTPLPIGLLHRLRLRTVRAKGLVVFLTESSATRHDTRTSGAPPLGVGSPCHIDIIPSSMASLRLDVQRCDDRLNHFRVAVTKSRLCAENIRLEVRL